MLYTNILEEQAASILMAEKLPFYNPENEACMSLTNVSKYLPHHSGITQHKTIIFKTQHVYNLHAYWSGH
jgi:hypothetical protein